MSANLFVGVTDYQWFDRLRSMAHASPVDEVNFWKPSGQAFQSLSIGELFLFKLHAPRHFIAGGGFFSRAPRLPIALAWDTFGAFNGVTNKMMLDERIRSYRRGDSDAPITCIVLSEPFFFRDEDFIPAPDDFAHNIPGRRYDTSYGSGRGLYEQVQERLARQAILDPGPAQFALMESRFGPAHPVAPRLGQGGFRVGVLENYRWRCAVSGERTVPVLEAAHIRRYSDGGGHHLSNGLLLRSDLHKLFDLGYIAVEPKERTLLVSPRIRREFDIGRDYYALAGRPLASPSEPAAIPDAEALRFHLENVYRP